jgi:hypothetical protein
MAMRTAVRTFDVVADDFVWPYQGLGGPNPQASRRHEALAHVLCCLPEADYRRLKAVINRFYGLFRRKRHTARSILSQLHQRRTEKAGHPMPRSSI